METRNSLVILAASAALCWSAVPGAQQAPKPGPYAPAQAAPAQRSATLYYDRYEASQRLRLRRETCMRDENMVAQYCVKKCMAGYLMPGGSTSVPRECRSAKPLPEGQLPQAYRRQPAVQPAPPPPSKSAPGA